MITYLETNLFESPALALVNTVNTVGVMGKGIALSFKQLYPKMFVNYKALCDAGKLTVGHLQFYRTANKVIINFPTKQHWRQPSKTEYIEAGLQTFTRVFGDQGISSVSFPQLGCGNGELDWESQVRPRMEHYLSDLPIPVYIHLYRQSSTFVPEHLDKKFIANMQLERERISGQRMWNDLNNVLLQTNGDKRDYADTEFLHLWVVPNRESVLYRGDVEDLWHMLRLNGVVNCGDVPQAIVDAGAEDRLFDLLEKLPYVRPVVTRPMTSGQICRGLLYAPQAAEQQPNAQMQLI